MIIVLMGVSGSGKTTIGTALAERLGWNFVDADDYHPIENREKMKLGIALTEEDRIPWLKTLSELIQKHVRDGKSMVLACSALRGNYRMVLGIDQQTVRSVYLKADRTLIERRLTSRHHDFFSSTLIESQFETLQEPDEGFIVAASQPPPVIVNQIIDWITNIR